MTTNALKIAVIAGDGIGKEVVPEGIRVLEAAGRKHGIAFDWKSFDWSWEKTAFKNGNKPTRYLIFTEGLLAFPSTMFSTRTASTGSRMNRPEQSLFQR